MNLPKQPLNVRENAPLYDTVGIYPGYGAGVTLPDGWFTSYVAMGNAAEIPFFNVRNKSVGLMWNNQDKRDMTSWPFIVDSIGVSFWANKSTLAPSMPTPMDITFTPEDMIGHMFVNDLPRHCGVIFRVVQDDVLKTHAFFCLPGYGPVGGGYARGQLSTANDVVSFTPLYDHHLSVHTQGTPRLPNRYPFPKPLEIPRDASISVRLVFNEYGRRMLQHMVTNTEWWSSINGVDDVLGVLPVSGIQVSLFGQRRVQQRGELHR